MQPAWKECLRDNSIGRALAVQFNSRARPSLDRVSRLLFNHIFFGAGSMCAVIPFLGVLLWTAGSSYVTRSGLRSRSRREAAWGEAMWFAVEPCVYAVYVSTIIAFAGYHFWMVEGQVTSCVYASGHWYASGQGGKVCQPAPECTQL